MTIDSALNELYPIHQIGSDGFKWWIGQIEEPSKNDPKQSGRCKVRIVGLHPKSCNSVSNDDLPWAVSTMPVTTPHIIGVSTTVSDQLEKGVWVVGFFLDNERQHPCIIGSIGGVAHSSDTPPEGEDPSKDCLEFTSFIRDNTSIADQGDSSKNFCAVPTTLAGHQQIGKEQEANSILASSETNLQVAQGGENSNVNPAGTKVCIERASTCKTDLKSKFTRLFSEMLYEVQRNDGKLGTYLVGEMSGGIYDQIDLGREYVDKAVLIMRTFIANIKGYVLEKIKEASKWITKSLLRPDKNGRGLNKLTDRINKQLKKVGCTMKDLATRLADWLEQIIFGYLFNIYKSAACQIDEFIQGLLNKIQSLMNELLEKILGPLQDILGAIAAPLNIIGDAINKVLNLLGIECNGPNEKCNPKKTICTDNSGDDEEDFLDRLLKDLNNWGTGQDWATYTCDDVYEGTKLKDTNIVFVGGIQKPDQTIKYLVKDIKVKEGETAIFTVERSGYLNEASSVEFSVSDGTATKGVDFEDVSGVVGFTGGQTSKTIEVKTYQDNIAEFQEDFFLKIVPDTPGSGTEFPSFFFNNIARCIITPVKGIDDPTQGGGDTDGNLGDDDDETSNVDFPSVNIENPDNWVDVVDPVDTGTAPTTAATYSVTADKSTVKEGEFVTFTIVTTNVAIGTKFDFNLVGSNITPSDFISNTLTGVFVVEDFGDYNAKVVVGIKEDTDLEAEETFVFAIPGTGAQASVIISSELTSLSDQDLSENDTTGSSTNRLPIAGEIITNDNGGVLEIPIQNSGDSFIERPAVFITGNGYGATGEMLLDNDGFAREVRITNPGFGYKINTPSTASKECIIDSFTMISPGRGYTSVPTVFVGKSRDIAEAQINTDGQVIAVRIKDRTVTFEEYPEIIISGGGGVGARFIPSFVCLDPDERVRVGSAKVGTGSYIDCP